MDVVLNSTAAGISRLRYKGGANPKALYDLVNGYVTTSQTMQSRDGTVTDATLPTGTLGLVAFEGQLHVFSSASQTMPSSLYVCHVIKHPTDETQTLTAINFAKPFVGFLYVSASFTDDSTWHYWLQSAATWAAATGFTYQEYVTPTVDNGFVYQPTNLITSPVWKASNNQAINDIVQASTYSSLVFKVTATTGTPVMTSDTEPTWPTVAGGTVVERRYLTNTSASTPPSTGTTTPPSPPAPTPGGDWNTRYGHTELK